MSTKASNMAVTKERISAFLFFSSSLSFSFLQDIVLFNWLCLVILSLVFSHTEWLCGDGRLLWLDRTAAGYLPYAGSRLPLLGTRSSVRPLCVVRFGNPARMSWECRGNVPPHAVEWLRWPLRDVLNEFISPVLLVINDSWRFHAESIEKPSSEPVLYIFFVGEAVCVLTCFFNELHTVVLGCWLKEHQG